jgi:hypothetical protein
MMLLMILALAALLLVFVLRIAASPPFPLLACLFAGWADRCRNGPELMDPRARP